MNTSATPIPDAGTWPGPQIEMARVKRLAKPFGPNLFVAQHCSVPARRTMGKTEREAAEKCFFYFQHPIVEPINSAIGLWAATRAKEAA